MLLIELAWTPARFEQFGVCHHLTRSLDECNEQAIFDRGQMH